MGYRDPWPPAFYVRKGLAATTRLSRSRRPGHRPCTGRPRLTTPTLERKRYVRLCTYIFSFDIEHQQQKYTTPPFPDKTNILYFTVAIRSIIATKSGKLIWFTVSSLKMQQIDATMQWRLTKQRLNRSCLLHCCTVHSLNWSCLLHLLELCLEENNKYVLLS